jgi:hypothetical protein
VTTQDADNHILHGTWKIAPVKTGALPAASFDSTSVDRISGLLAYAVASS